MKTKELIQMALQEDLPQGDLTTEGLGIDHQWGRCRLVAKEDLIVSGTELFAETFRQRDPEVQIIWHFKDGDLVLEGQSVASLKGNLVEFLKAERVALNFLGHLSGIATFTRCFVKALGNSNTRILDTRKTMPLYRHWEKKAVKDGGGQNHRLHLSDGLMIKENHVRLAGGMVQAIEKLRGHPELPLIVECRNKEEVLCAAQMKVQRILLDNMTNETLKECLKLIPPSIETEASGNMSLERVEGLKDYGINFISIGALTHSAPTADLSLLFEWEKN